MTIDNHDGIARLTLDADAAALTGALIALDADADARVLLLSGDWSAIGGSLRESADDGPVAALAALRIPVVAWVHGDCHDEAFELALAADIRLADESAAFRMAHARDGRLPSHGGTQRLPRAVGRGQALRLLLTGETLDADEALRVGLVHDIADLEDAEALAAGIADAGPVAARYVKEAIAASTDLPLREGMRLEADLSILLHSTADREEGLRAFAEKRKPRFEGR
ncbi:MAG: enoyl-CoA hydratase-related protein [Chloroflexota bacterium]|nr:enoyl-CoA hydratase-related protein [Chloroflexota bacterium]